MEAEIFKTDGTRHEILPKDGKYFSLEEIQEIVGGYIQMIPCVNPDYLCIMNEEGKLKGLPFNGLATEEVDDNLFMGDYIVGDVLITHRKYVE